MSRSGERREWRKKPHQANEALDIVVGARALAWGEGAGQLTNSEWRERAAKAHAVLDQPSLLTAPLVAPEALPAEAVVAEVAAAEVADAEIEEVGAVGNHERAFLVLGASLTALVDRLVR